MQLKATKCPKSFRSLSVWIFRVFSEGRSPELQPRRPAMSFPTQLWSPSLHQQQQRTTVASCHWNCICQRWRRNREGHKPGVQGLQTPVESQWSRHRTQVGPHAQKGLALGSMLCCCHLQIINNCRMATFLFCTGLANDVAEPEFGETQPLIEPCLCLWVHLHWWIWCYLSRISDIHNHRILDLEVTSKLCALAFRERDPLREKERVFLLLLLLLFIDSDSVFMK